MLSDLATVGAGASQTLGLFTGQGSAIPGVPSASGRSGVLRPGRCQVFSLITL